MTAQDETVRHRGGMSPTVAAAWIGALGMSLAAGISLLDQTGPGSQGSTTSPPADAGERFLTRIQGDWIGVGGPYDGTRLTFAGPVGDPRVLLCAPDCVDIGAGLLRATTDGAEFGFIDAVTLEQETAFVTLEDGRLIVSVRDGAAAGAHAFRPE